ncbi:MAG: histidine phosphatase family protein [Actinomycetota bacterium]|nr:histidine phosphatase family protein [Actinomycetota bacterium]
MTRLLLLRHGESTWNTQGRWQGFADPPLSPRGKDQARSAGPLLAPLGISAVVSSDLRRARGTAQLIAAALPSIGPIGIEPGLREYDLGAWSGLTRDEIETAWPGGVEDWRNGRLPGTPGGERRAAFVDRISAALARVAAARPDQTVLVVSHSGVIRAVAHSLGQPPQRFPQLAGLWVEAGPGGFRAGPVVSLLDLNQTVTDEGEGAAHLPPAVVDTPGQ